MVARPALHETEAQFQRAVIELAQWYGWKVHHTRPARTLRRWVTPVQGDPGYQDLTLVHPCWGRCVVSELKVQGRQPMDVQRAWLNAWRQVPGIEVFVWFPRDWEAIVKTLSQSTQG